MRIGDIFSLLIETHVLHGRKEEAARLLTKLRTLIPASGIRYFISEQMLELLGPEEGPAGEEGQQPRPAGFGSESPQDDEIHEHFEEEGVAE